MTADQTPPVRPADRVGDCLLIAPLTGWDADRTWRASTVDGQGDDVIVQFRRLTDETHASDVREAADRYRTLAHSGLCRLRGSSVETLPDGSDKDSAVSRGGRWLSLVSDPVAGTPVSEWVPAHPAADAVERLGLLRMVASALDWLHAAGLGHGNVRADAIVVTADGAAILLAPEFDGASRLADVQATDRDDFLELAVQVLTAQPVPRSADRAVDVRALRQLLLTAPALYRRGGLGARLVSELTAPAETRTRQLRPWLDSASYAGNSATVTDPAAQAVTPNLAPPSTRPKATLRSRRWLRSAVAGGVILVLVGGGLAVFRPWADRGRSGGPAPVAVAATWLGTDCSTAVALPDQLGPPSAYGLDPRAKVLESGGGAIWHTGELTVILRNKTATNVLLIGAVPHRVGVPTVTPPAWIYRPSAGSCDAGAPPAGVSRHYTMDLSNLNSLRADDATPANVIGNPLQIPAGGTATLRISVTTCGNNYQFQFRFAVVVQGSNDTHAVTLPPAGSRVSSYAMDGFAQNTEVYTGTDPNTTTLNGHDPACGGGSS